MEENLPARVDGGRDRLLCQRRPGDARPGAGTAGLAHPRLHRRTVRLPVRAGGLVPEDPHRRRPQCLLAGSARCPDATDEAFLGGSAPGRDGSLNANQPFGEGVCMMSTTVIQLKSIVPDRAAASGWTYLSTLGGFATYYTLTPV